MVAAGGGGIHHLHLLYFLLLHFLFSSLFFYFQSQLLKEGKIRKQGGGGGIAARRCWRQGRSGGTVRVVAGGGRSTILLIFLRSLFFSISPFSPFFFSRLDIGKSHGWEEGSSVLGPVSWAFGSKPPQPTNKKKVSDLKYHSAGPLPTTKHRQNHIL